MEKGEGERLGVDYLLAQWALDEGIIDQKDDGEYKLNNVNGTAVEKESNNWHSSFVSAPGRSPRPEANSEPLPDEVEPGSLYAASAMAAAAVAGAATKHDKIDAS